MFVLLLTSVGQSNTNWRYTRKNTDMTQSTVYVTGKTQTFVVTREKQKQDDSLMTHSDDRKHN